MPPPLLTPFVFKVRDLQRRGLNVAAICRRTGASETDVLEAHRIYAVPVNDPTGSGNERSDEQFL